MSHRIEIALMGHARVQGYGRIVSVGGAPYMEITPFDGGEPTHYNLTAAVFSWAEIPTVPQSELTGALAIVQEQQHRIRALEEQLSALGGPAPALQDAADLPQGWGEPIRPPPGPGVFTDDAPDIPF